MTNPSAASTHSYSLSEVQVGGALATIWYLLQAPDEPDTCYSLSPRALQKRGDQYARSIQIEYSGM